VENGKRITAEQATAFDHHSEIHAAILAQAAVERGCTCEAYRDWYTYNRWLAQGLQVQRGEHGVKLSTFVPVTKPDEKGNEIVVGKRPVGTTVFCRHQVKVREA
jgi:antirestriction protein ArdC